MGASTCELLDSDGRLLGHGSTRCVVIDIPTVDPEDVPGHPADLESPDPWQAPMTLEIQKPAAFDDMTGLEVCLGYVRGQFDVTPIDLLFGGRGITFEDGLAIWELPTSPWLASGAGTIFGGAIARFAQATLETAMLTTYPAQTIYATLDLQVHFLRPTLPETGKLRAEATVDQRGRTVTFASARVTNESGKLVALARASALVVPDGMRRILRGDFAEDMLDAAIAGGGT